jgi:dTMP kinase
MTGRYVAFEGGEGCGKSTQAARLAARLDAVLTHEPGATAAGAAIRSLLLDPATGMLDARAEALLMAADRAQHTAEVVRPALDAGRDVVSDRSAHSSLAYQGYGRGLLLEDVRWLSTWATGDTWPDLVVLLDVPAEVAASRVAGAPDRIEAAGHEFHRRVAEGFRALAAADPDRWVVVDGAGEPDEVEAAVAAAMMARWPDR